MPESRHGYLTTNEGIHIAYQWIFLNEADRLAKTDFAATDVGKMARQQDDNTLWLLDDLTPTWVAVTGVRQLSGLSDVDLDSIPLADGQILSYNATYGVWQPTEISEFIGSYSLDDLDDVDVTPNDGQLLSYSALSGNWIATDYPHAHPWSDITSGIPDYATRWPTWTEVTDKPTTFTPSSHTHDDLYYTEAESDARFAPVVHAHAWSDITSGLPEFATRWPTWTEVTDKPTTFTPSSHTHASSDINSGTLSPARGGTGVDNGSNALTVPATGTAALLGAANVFTQNQTINAFLGIGAASPTYRLEVEDITASGNILLGAFRGAKGFVEFKNLNSSNRVQISIVTNALVTATTVFGTNVVGDTTQRFGFTGEGRMSWSPGSGGADTNLYRASAGVLQTDGQFSIKTGLTTAIGLIVDTPASPTANLMELRNNTSPIFSVTASGGAIVGSSPSLVTTNIANFDATPAFQVVSSGANASLLMMRNGANSTPGRIFFLKTRGASFTDYAAVSSGDQLGAFSFAGGNGTKAAEGAQIRAHATAAQTGTIYTGAALSFWTAEAGSSPLAQRLTIDSNGKTGIGNTSPSAQLDIKTGLTSTIGLIVDTPASPTANLLELRSNTTKLFWVEANGDVFSRHAYPYYIMDMASPTDRATILFRELSGSYQPYNSVNAYGTTFGDAALNGKLEMKSSWGVVINTNGAPQFEIGLTGQIKVNQAVATSASTDQPSATAPYRLPIYNMAGALLGYIPIYATWS
jgi:hypothetical protein